MRDAARDIAAAVDAPAVLAAQGLTRCFDGGRGVSSATLSLHGGQFVALVGPSGAGKTTLLRLLAGLDVPAAGEVRRDGVPVTRPRRGDTRVALVFQRPRLVGRRSALDNVLAGRLGHMSRWRGLLARHDNADLAIALQALADVGLLDRADARADVLSGGEQQRVAIARALAQQPRVLLADEPVASLDPANARRVLSILHAASRRGLAVLASLHQPDLAREFADRVLTLDGGRLG
jgi:phosphonate transport system ATP-binding protein